MTACSPGWQGSKGKEKEDDDVDNEIGDYEDPDNESHRASPTPAAKGPLRKGGKKFLDADRSWTAEEAYEGLMGKLAYTSTVWNTTASGSRRTLQKPSTNASVPS